MQSGHGVSEFQLVDGGSSLLSMTEDMSNSSLLQKHQDQQQRFYHLPHNPTNQTFFQHPLQFQLLQHQQQQRRLYQQLGLDHESGPDNSNSPSRIIGVGTNSLPFIVSNFKLPEETNGNREAFNADEKLLGCNGGKEVGSDSRVAIPDHQQWHHRQEEPFWTPLGTEYINRNNKRLKEKEKIEVTNKLCKRGDDANEEGKNSGSNYGLFGELEAIYTHGGCSGNGNGGGNNQTGSGSALTGDNPLITAVELRPAGNLRSSIDHASETSTGEEAPLKKVQKNRKKKKRKQLSSITSFFQTLVTQLMDHQENLHRKFLDVMEKRDEERTKREEEWRRQETTKSNTESIARAHEQAIASSREAAIVDFLEKITGETIKLPTKNEFNFQIQLQEESKKEEVANQQSHASFNNDNVSNNNANRNDFDNTINNSNTRRWPKSEVDALIQVRSSFETRFQEPGLKGPLWEEVSSLMASMGYQRSAKRCKEKWENINKYFRKTKDCAKKRSQHSKTCPYFDQLDQLYSKSVNNSPKLSLPSICGEPKHKDNLELLDAIVVQSVQNPSFTFVQGSRFKFSEMGSQRLDFNDNGNDNVEEDSSAKTGNEEDNDDEEEHDEEGEEENEEHMQNEGIGRIPGEEETPKGTLFFSLES